MNIVLVSNNLSVRKLAMVSSDTINANLYITESSIDIDTSLTYEIIIIDSELYTKETMNYLKNNVSFQYSIYLKSKYEDSVSSFDYNQEKPFVPLEFAKHLSMIKSTAKNLNIDYKGLYSQHNEDTSQSIEVKKKLFKTNNGTIKVNTKPTIRQIKTSNMPKKKIIKQKVSVTQNVANTSNQKENVIEQVENFLLILKDKKMKDLIKNMKININVSFDNE